MQADVLKIPPRFADKSFPWKAAAVIGLLAATTCFTVTFTSNRRVSSDTAFYIVVWVFSAASVLALQALRKHSAHNPYVVISSEGIWINSLPRVGTIPWFEITRVTVVEMQGTHRIGFELQNTERVTSKLPVLRRLAWRILRSGPSARENKGDLEVFESNLTISLDEFLAAVSRFHWVEKNGK
jgi:hypothetical protein